jgi:hypothetical protein|tara:strand:- start:158 stop:355 length:198 start_codon:yes stop_codon:yes gene_type:complete
MNQRYFIKQRTNRRVATKPYEGPNKRKGLGRRKTERYSYYAYITMIGLLAATMAGFIIFIIYNII